MHLADNAAFAHALAENVALLVAQLMDHHDAFVASAKMTGKNVAPRVVALLDVMQLNDIFSVGSEDSRACQSARIGRFTPLSLATARPSNASFVGCVEYDDASLDGAMPKPDGYGSDCDVCDFAYGDTRLLRRQAP